MVHDATYLQDTLTVNAEQQLAQKLVNQTGNIYEALKYK